MSFVFGKGQLRLARELSHRQELGGNLELTRFPRESEQVPENCLSVLTSGFYSQYFLFLSFRKPEHVTVPRAVCLDRGRVRRKVTASVRPADTITFILAVPRPQLAEERP